MSTMEALRTKNRVFSLPLEEIKDGSIECGLLLLSAWQAEHPGIELTSRDIAFVCGCHHNLIFEIEKRALKKLRKFRTETLI